MNVDHQAELIRQQIKDYCESHGIELTDEEQRNAINGVTYWLDDALRDAVSDSVYFARVDKKGVTTHAD